LAEAWREKFYHIIYFSGTTQKVWQKVLPQNNTITMAASDWLKLKTNFTKSRNIYYDDQHKYVISYDSFVAVAVLSPTYRHGC